MKLNSPLPQSLPKECQKAARIFKSFIDSGNNGLDGVIPRTVIENAKGFAIFSIFKAGIVFSARAGSGIVIAKLGDGNWSAPSAIGIAGLGVGSQLGAEITDFLIILNSRSALKTFMAAGSLSLGGNASIALGPLGRNGEAAGAVNSSGKIAAMYSYSKTRGLFGGLSIEGSIIVERQDANAIAYNSDVTVQQLLSGEIEPPSWAKSELIKTITACTGVPGVREWVWDSREDEPGYAFGGVGSPSENRPPFLSRKSRDRQSSLSSLNLRKWGNGKKTDSPVYGGDEERTNSGVDDGLNRFGPDPRHAPGSSQASDFDTYFETDFISENRPRHKRLAAFGSADLTPSNNSRISSSPQSHRRIASEALSSTQSAYNNNTRSSSLTNPFSSLSIDDTDDIFSGTQTKEEKRPFHHIQPKPELSKPLLPHEGVARAVALYSFQAKQAGDLSFAKGDVITITEKSGTTDDWWSGRLSDGSQGVFPANFVEVV